MQEAAGLLVGDHDFRNFCKLNEENVGNLRRVIMSAEVKEVYDGPTLGGLRVFLLHIKGTAFLWHQARDSQDPARNKSSAAVYLAV